MKHFFVLLSLFIFFGVLLFRDIPSLYFFSDDFVWLLEAKHDTVAALPIYFIDSEGFFYRPITKVYFWVMWLLVQDNAVWYHLVSLGLHTIISIAVYFLSLLLLHRVTFGSPNKITSAAISGVAALLFFVHPAHLESIVWPSVTTELIPAFCSVLGLCLFVLGYLRRAWFYYLITILLFSIGLGSHEYMVVFPVLLYVTHQFLLVTEKNGRFNLAKPFSLAPVFYCAVLSIEVVYFVLRAVSNAHWSGGDYSYDLVRLPFNIIGNLFGYIGLLFVGVPFVDWYFQLRFFLREHLILSSAVLLLIGLLILLGVKKLAVRRPMQSFSLVVYLGLFAFVALLPFLGLGAIAERYLYLPSVSLILLLVYCCYLLGLKIRLLTNSISEYTAFFLITGMMLCYFVFSVMRDVQEWQIASNYVQARLVEFQEQCDSFKEGELLVRNSPPNRLGRAWVFQVGYEEGANLYCDKKLQIQRK